LSLCYNFELGWFERIKIVHRTAITAALLTLIIPFAQAEAGRYSWFNDPLSDDLAFNSGGLPRPGGGIPPTFDVNAYATPSFGSRVGEGMGYRNLGEEPREVSDVVRLYGKISPGPAYRYPPLGDETDVRLNAFGAKWLHRLNAIHSFAVSAGYSETASSTRLSPDTFDTRAAFSWTSKWAGGYRPGVTGSIFVGDETAKDEAYRYLGRKYYGFAIGGELTLFREHTPYISYRLQRSQYETAVDPLYSPYRSDDRSLVAAGWRWQVQRNWSLQAEASYGLGGAGLDLQNYERSRLFFGTRFDFK